MWQTPSNYFAKSQAAHPHGWAVFCKNAIFHRPAFNNDTLAKSGTKISQNKLLFLKKLLLFVISYAIITHVLSDGCDKIYENHAETLAKM